MKKFWILLLSGLLVTALILTTFPSLAKAQTLDNCRIEASKWSPVSLGFPLRPQRLANITNPKILVMPYQLKGEAKYTLSDKDKNGFYEAAANISLLSQNKSNINLIFSQTIVLSTTAEELNIVKRNVQLTFRKDFEKSTFGFVEKAVKEADPIVDFKAIDAVILYGATSKVIESIAEAQMYLNDSNLLNNDKKSSGGKWWDPLKTEEGEIYNALLIYNDNSSEMFTHEILHLYGLTDLYGSNYNPRLSAMATNGLTPPSLLPYEKWVLGWLPDSSVTCVDIKNDISQNSSKNRFVLDYSTGDKTLIIPKGPTSALVVDVINRGSDIYLLYYELENDSRPPIKTFQEINTLEPNVNIGRYGGVSSLLDSPDYSLLISDNTGSSVAINLIPKSELGKDSSNELIKKAESKKVELDATLKAKQEAEARAAAELKAKQEAEAKAAADLKAKQEAEAKAAAELKSKQEAAAKAAAATAATTKKTTITCVKGKLTKKVTAVKPTCPSGYKVKK